MLRTMRADLRILPAEKLAFFDNHLILLVSRTPDAVMDAAIGLRKLPDNPVFASGRLARLYGRPQPDRLTDFELARCHALAGRAVQAIAEAI
jgi:hypothetical protein